MVKKTKTEKTGASQEAMMLAYLCIKDLKTLPEMIGVLDRFNFSDADIAKICDSTSGSIRVARFGLKNKKRNKNVQRVNQQNSQEEE